MGASRHCRHGLVGQGRATSTTRARPVSASPCSTATSRTITKAEHGERLPQAAALPSREPRQIHPLHPRSFSGPWPPTRTFSIIKPDATRRNLTGAVTKMLEEAGLRVVASKRIRMTREQAEGFYGVHRERPFFNDLVAFMISGPVVVQVLEGENAVARNRDVMGATNPANADDGTIRKDLCRIDRGELGPWLGQRRERRDRDRLLLQAGRDRRLSVRRIGPQLHRFHGARRDGGHHWARQRRRRTGPRRIRAAPVAIFARNDIQTPRKGAKGGNRRQNFNRRRAAIHVLIEGSNAPRRSGRPSVRADCGGATKERRVVGPPGRTPDSRPFAREPETNRLDRLALLLGGRIGRVSFAVSLVRALRAWRGSRRRRLCRRRAFAYRRGGNRDRRRAGGDAAPRRATLQLPRHRRRRHDAGQRLADARSWTIA